MNDLYEIRQTKSMGKGIFAKKDIEVGTNILSLDRRKYLTYRIVAEHTFFGKLCDLQQIDRKVHFAFYLAFAHGNRKYQKKHSQKAINYIDNLPQQYHSLICWTEDELQMIKNKELIKRALQKRKQLEEDFLQVKKFLSESEDCEYIPNYRFNSDPQQESDEQLQRRKYKSQEYINESDQTEPQQQVWNIDFKEVKKNCQLISFEDFLKFYTAVETRRIYYPSDFQQKVQLGALVPILEMFNHSPQGQVYYDTYFVKTKKTIKKDDQIFISYGEKNNEDLFFDYGFLIDENFNNIKNQFLEDIETSNVLKNWQNENNEKQIKQFRYELANKYNRLYGANQSKFIQTKKLQQ